MLVLDFFLPAYLIMGVAGTPVQLAVLHVCNEFENSSTAMAVYAGTFAASSCVFVVFQVCTLRRAVCERRAAPDPPPRVMLSTHVPDFRLAHVRALYAVRAPLCRPMLVCNL
jgi:hypothetical protein